MSLISSNPFATRFIRPGELIYRFVVDAAVLGPGSNAATEQIDGMIEQLIDCRAGSIVGPHGTGKSTLLQTLMPALVVRFAAIKHVRLQARESDRMGSRFQHLRMVDRELRSTFRSARQPADLRDGLLIVDGAEQMLPWQRRRILTWARRNRFAVLATSHRPLRGLTTLHETRLSAELIGDLAAKLTQNATDLVARTVADELNNRDLDRIDNLRELWFELYDVVQTERHPLDSVPVRNQQDGRASSRDFGSNQTAQCKGRAFD